MGFHILLSNVDCKVTGAALYDGIHGHKTIKNKRAHDCLLNSTSGSLGHFKFTSLVKLVYEV